MSEDLKKRLDAAKAARAALAEQFNKVDETEELAKAVEAEERQLKEDQAYAALCEQYGKDKLAKIDTDLGAVILLRPQSPTYRKFCDKEDPKVADIENLVRPCVKYPTIPEFDTMTKEQTGILLRCANVIAALAGIRKDVLAGK